MKQISAKAKGAVALVAAGAFSAALLAEPICCSRRDDMQSFKSVFVKEKVYSQKEVLDKIQSAKNITQVSEAVFGFLKGESTKEQKFAVVDAFSAKFKGDALKDFVRHAHIDFGFEFKGGLEKFQVSDPAVATYMRALAHGFTSFGEMGLKFAVTLVSLQPNPSPFGIFDDRSSPLSSQIALLVCANLQKNNGLDAKSAIEYLLPYISKENITETAKKSLIGLADMIDPGSLNAIATTPGLDPHLKEFAMELQKKYQ